MSERRRFSRIEFNHEARFEAGDRIEKGRLRNISEHGALADIEATPEEGAELTLLCEHPLRRQPVAIAATVVRAMPNDQLGGARVGLQFGRGLTGRPVNRRNSDRFNSAIPAELHSDFQRAYVTIADLSANGAAITCSEQLDPGPGRIRFRHPITRTPCVARVVVLPTTRRSRDGQFRHGARFLDSLRELARDPQCGSRLPLPLASVSGAFFEGNVDTIESQELNTRGLQRRLAWQADSGFEGQGRLVLASGDAVLIACTHAPPKGSHLQVLMMKPTDSPLPALRLSLRVERAGSHLVAGREPGFLAEVTGFPFQVDKDNYRELASWLANKGAAGV